MMVIGGIKYNNMTLFRWITYSRMEGDIICCNDNLDLEICQAKHWDCRNRADLIESATPCHDAQVVELYWGTTHSTRLL